jgi:hypothetical protein
MDEREPLIIGLETGIAEIGEQAPFSLRGYLSVVSMTASFLERILLEEDR